MVLTPTEVERVWRQVLDWRPAVALTATKPVLRVPAGDGGTELVAPATADPALVRSRAVPGWGQPLLPEPDEPAIGAGALDLKVHS